MYGGRIMSIILYGGDRDQVIKQLNCDHKDNWHGPCMDSISRYYKCKKCFCIERDLNSLQEYHERYLETIRKKTDKHVTLEGLENDD